MTYPIATKGRANRQFRQTIVKGFSFERWGYLICIPQFRSISQCKAEAKTCLQNLSILDAWRSLHPTDKNYIFFSQLHQFCSHLTIFIPQPPLNLRLVLSLVSYPYPIMSILHGPSMKTNHNVIPSGNLQIASLLHPQFKVCYSNILYSCYLSVVPCTMTLA